MKTIRLFYLTPQVDLGLLFLRLAGCFMLLYVHGAPKVLHYADELARIEDPFGLGASLSLWAAIFAEVVCPVFILLGVFTRMACLPIVVVLLIAMVAVHPDWSVAEGQFGWLLLIIFTTIALAGPGRLSLWPGGSGDPR
ncbi:DoxX family protein [Acerihabitans arboris]|uniref:DoxX family membrane protein n=1 Tax=Acerihabitans arboris TaxID=2691583 RepID=A0A845SIX1_9GAMM|nr:DoxX family protein [Acerihabitans arboris]NDL65133.1 DoxX family membrane protein [Acerihabitans arboris]